MQSVFVPCITTLRLQSDLKRIFRYEILYKLIKMYQYYAIIALEFLRSTDVKYLHSRLSVLSAP
jgi:hypothetical protein